MFSYLKNTKAILSVGGDNYSLDYGKPELFTVLDEIAFKYKKPIIIWGASIGPFNKLPKYEEYIINHFKKVTGIFVRESVSFDYLASKGLRENVYLSADPAFLLKSVEPVLDRPIVDGAVGINLSPLMARYVTGGNYKKWVILAADIVREICAVTRRKIYLIPHETSPHTNDYVFLSDVLSLLHEVDVTLISNRYNAAETKWIIGKMASFAGARTHSTIAAISSGVPTLSFVYSIKATGINKDFFGHDQYCIYYKDCHPSVVAEKMNQAINEFGENRHKFLNSILRMQKLADKGGQILGELIQ